MGLLTFYPPGTLVSEKVLIRGAEHNRDGHGFGVAGAGGLIVRRGPVFDDLLREFCDLRTENPYAKALFHSRRATKGVVSLGNCHPVQLGSDLHTVIAHSGTLPRRSWPGSNETRSDTRVAADGYLRRFGSLHKRRNRIRAERWMGPGNTMVVLTGDPLAPQQGYLLNQARGFWRNGVWYSSNEYFDAGL